MVSKTLSTSQRFAALHIEIPKLTEFAQVLYMLLLTHSDDFGRQAGDSFTVKHAVVPTSPRRISAIETALAALRKVGLIAWYEVDGRKLIQIQDFDAYQTGLHKRTSSKYPEFPGTAGNVPPKRTEQKGREVNPTEGSLDVSFARWWDAYPKKQARGMAEHVWVNLAPDATLVSVLIAAVEAQKQWPQWQKNGGTYIPKPDRWLRDQCWLDEPPEVAPPATTQNMAGIASWLAAEEGQQHD